MDCSFDASKIALSERLAGEYIPTDAPHVFGGGRTCAAVSAGAAGRAGRGRVLVGAGRHFRRLVVQSGWYLGAF